MKKKLIPFAAMCVALSLLSGCASVGGMAQQGFEPTPSAKTAADGLPERMIVWKADIEITVWDVSNTVSRVTSLLESQGGFVDTSTTRETTRMLLRIPATSFKSLVADIERMGTVRWRRVTSEDVTDQYVDVESRLTNKIVLRDRLKELLSRAVDVKDVLAIELELNRIQSDIDSMKARLKLLAGRVEYATIDLEVIPRPILGPLGYVAKGMVWAVEKLFIIRE